MSTHTPLKTSEFVMRLQITAEAYAYGFDLRLNGEFVPGTESWFSFGYLKTEENISNQGFIARPTINV